MSHEMLETADEFRKLIAEGWELHANLKAQFNDLEALFNDLEEIHAKLMRDVDSINRARGYTYVPEAPKLSKLALVKTDPPHEGIEIRTPTMQTSAQSNLPASVCSTRGIKPVAI